MVADTAADMEVHMVADTEVDKVADMVADMVVDMPAYLIFFLFLVLAQYTIYMVADKVAGMVATMAADQRRCCLIGPKVFRPEPNPTCVSSELCEFIPTLNGDFWTAVLCLCPGLTLNSHLTFTTRLISQPLKRFNIEHSAMACDCAHCWPDYMWKSQFLIKL